MNIIAASFDVITARAKDADRYLTDYLKMQYKALDDAGRVTISLGTMEDGDLVVTTVARRTARAAIDAAFSAHLMRQYALIAAVPKDREMRDDLAPMSAPALLLSTIERGIERVRITVGRDGSGVGVLKDGEPQGEIGANDIHIANDDLVIVDVGRWSIPDIEAATETGGFGFLMADGTLIEIPAE